MNKEKQCIAIAEACGWTDIPIVNGKYGQTDLPDYLNDLNAMHAAMGSLNETQMGVWLLRVSEICSRDCQEGKSRYSSANATAAQRAEAFLRAIGKWEDL